MNGYPVLLLLIPAAAALITPMGTAVRPNFGRVLALLAYAAGLVYGALMYPAILAHPQSVLIGGWRPPFGINLYVSGLSLGLVLLVYAAAFVVLLSDWANTAGNGANPRRRGQFYLLYSLLVMASIGLILTADLFNMFVFLEIAGISTFALVASSRSAAAPAGSLRYLILAQLATLLMLAGIALVYSATGVLNVASLSTFRALNPAFAFLVGVLILMPILLELKQFPFNGWLGGAYRGATPAIGATMSGLVTIAITLVLARLAVGMTNGSSAFAAAGAKIRLVVLALGVITVLLGEAAAFREREIKRVLAYSSAGQMGMIAIGIAVATPFAIRGVLFLLVSHTLAKILLFLVAGNAGRLSGRERWDEMIGLARRYPLLGILFAIGAMALMGIPLFSGFWGKLDLIRATVAAGGVYVVALIALLVATVVEGVYFMKIAHALFQSPAVEETAESAATAHRPYHFGFLVPALALAAGIIALGIFPGLIDPWLTSGTAELLHPVQGYAAHILASGGAQ